MSKISELLNRAIESFYKTMDTLQGHIADRGNPHGITKEQVGLSNVSNIKAASSAEFNAHKSASVLAHPDGSVTGAKLANGAVTAAKLGDGAVTPEKIYGAVPVAKGGTGAATPEAAREALGAMSVNAGNEILNNTQKIKSADGGFSGGGSSFAGKGGAVGKEAIAGEGFAGGYRAETIGNGGTVDAIQLGTGTNWEEKTLKVYDFKLMDAEGNIPHERLEKGCGIKRYGVRFGGSANSGSTVKRLYNAKGLTSTPGTNYEQGYSDFDSIYPWGGRRRCCGYFDQGGTFIVNAYEGEPGYTTNGSNGEVWVETPLFFYSHSYGDDGSEEICISPYPVSGYLPSPAHIKADGTLRQKVYTAAYPMGIVDGMPTSRSGVVPANPLPLNDAVNYAKKLGEGHRTTSIAEHYMKCLLMWVEFATRDIQMYMMGCTALVSSAQTVTVGQTDSNSFIISNKNASKFVGDVMVSIGTEQQTTDIIKNRQVIGIYTYDSENMEIRLDGAPFTTTAGNYVSFMPWITGTCDEVMGSSGSYISNTSGKYTCIYRGEESPFGNQLEVISDVLVVKEGSGTTDDPYVYVPHYLPDTNKYTGDINEAYIRLNYNCANKTGLISRLGYDSRYPFVRIPTELGASSSSGYSDRYLSPAYPTNVISVNGTLSDGNYAGISYVFGGHRTSYTSFRGGARLSFNQRI